MNVKTALQCQILHVQYIIRDSEAFKWRNENIFQEGNIYHCNVRESISPILWRRLRL